MNSSTTLRATAPGAALAVAALLAQSACRKTVSSAASGPSDIASSGSWAGHVVRTAGERERPTQVVILLHGWGAPGDDLVPLSQVLSAPGRLFVFPEAQLTSPGGGRAWWHLDINRVISARERGQERDLRNEVPTGLAEARAGVAAVVAEAQKRTKLPSSSIVLGGFSQGAMLAMDVALSLKDHPAAVVALSGTLLTEAQWRSGIAALTKAMPTFLSHGVHDPVLPFHLAEALRDCLQAANQPVTWVPFSGGHEIPREVLIKLSSFLNQAGKVAQ